MTNSQWIVKKNVPILDEHELKDEDGQVIIKVDEAKLRTIARKNNERVAATGDWTPIVVGHTKDDASEEEQPEIIGYAANFRVGPLFDTGRKAIHTTWRILKDKVHLARKFPRRSVELWLGDWKIDPISVLGATTPERDLGLLLFTREGKRDSKYTHVLRYSQMPFNDPGVTAPQDPASMDQGGDGNPLVAELLAALEQTDVFQWAHQKMQEEMAGPGLGLDQGLDPGLNDPVPMDGEVPVEDDYDDDFDDGDEPYDDEEDDSDEDEDEEDDDEDEDEDNDDEDKPARFSAVASGTNTFPPGGNIGKRKMNKVNDVALGGLIERVKIRKDQERLKFARQEKRIAALEKDNARLKYQARKSQILADLTQLEAEGFDIDRQDELNDLLALSDKQYEKALGKIRKKYSRAPVGVGGLSPEDMRTPSAKGLNKAQMDDIVEYANANGLSFSAAKIKLTGGAE